MRDADALIDDYWHSNAQTCHWWPIYGPPYHARASAFWIVFNGITLNLKSDRFMMLNMSQHMLGGSLFAGTNPYWDNRFPLLFSLIPFPVVNGWGRSILMNNSHDYIMIVLIWFRMEKKTIKLFVPYLQEKSNDCVSVYLVLHFPRFLQVKTKSSHLWV